ncbi:retrovirus-related pol polyprotein from transposon TNT 1-94 [Tanacetum coccineum]
MVPRAILMKFGLVSVNIARQVNAAHSKTIVNAARPMSYLFKTTHSTVKRLIHKNTTFKNSNINQRVNTIRDKNVNIVRLKVVVNAVKGNNVNVVKASAFWVWKPKTKVLDHVSKHNSASITLNKFDHIDAQGRSNLMEDMFLLKETPKEGKSQEKGTKASDNTGQARKETEPVKNYILLPLWTADLPFSQDPKSSHDDESKPSSDDGKKVDEDLRKESECNDQEKTSIELPFDLNMPALEDYRDDEDDGAEANMNNLDTTIQEEPKKVIHALKNPSWIEAMQEELLQFKLQGVWTLVDLPIGKRAIGSKWVFKNKKDEREIVRKNKARLVAQGYTQEEGIDYDEEEIERRGVCMSTHQDFEDQDFPDRQWVSKRKIEKTLFIKSTKGLQVQQKKDGIFISQDKYVVEVLKKFGFTEVKTASTPMETQKPLLKDEDGEEVDVHMYRSMISIDVSYIFKT